MQGKTIADRDGATLWGGWVVWWTGQAPTVRHPLQVAVGVTSAQCGIDAETSSGRRRNYWQGDLVERLVISPVCAADDYEMTVGLFGLRGIETAPDTMRFSVIP